MTNNETKKKKSKLYAHHHSHRHVHDLKHDKPKHVSHAAMHKEELIGTLDKNLMPFCWHVKLNHRFSKRPKPFTRPRFRQTIHFIGIGLRCRKYLQKCRNKNIQSHIEFFSPLQCKQSYGVPLGGIGTGTIGRTFTGDFARFQLAPGIYEHETCESNMFTCCLRKNSETIYQQCLTTRASKQKGLKAWQMQYKGENASYYALYPESWTIYDLPGQNVTLTCHQLSPIIPQNYKDSSLPVGIFNWTIENKNTDDLEFSLMFTWQAGSASTRFELTDVKSRSFENYINYGTHLSGVCINQKLRNMPLDYCVAARKTEHSHVTYNCKFYTSNEESGTEVWNNLYKHGDLKNNKFYEDDLNTKKDRNRFCVAVCVKIHLKALKTERIDFALVWNMPKIYFSGDENKLFKRYYTNFFSDYENPDCAMRIAAYAFANEKNWLDSIRRWRTPILENKKLPNHYKCSLFNELYFISDGGTVWLCADYDNNKLVQEYGRFAYLEGHEYRMYNTYDVHFYASFALLKLWPKLQLSIQYDFAETICKEINVPTKFLYKGALGKQKNKHLMPHDLGDPEDKPWENLNAYAFHDTKEWKDLNLKFILTTYRDYYFVKDMQYLSDMWPKIKILMTTVQSQDHDGDGLVDSEGLPDQTYDAWSVTGASAYCGGLHVAALKCFCEMAKLLDDSEAYESYSQILVKAKRSYEEKLWNGKYYKYDCSTSDYNDSIMADMCCGHWYLRACGLGHQVFEKEKIKSCLETIFEYNVMKYGEGQRGAVNGMRPDGKTDITSMQSEEMWIGVTDSLASLMIFEDMNDKAWKTIEGMYDLLYNKLGLAFQTPEALLKTDVYRSLGYMRPLCIWSIQYAIDELQQQRDQSV